MTDTPPQKRSSSLSMNTVGLAAVAGIGGFALVDAAGLASRPCTERIIVSSAAECASRVPGSAVCATAFANGGAVGMTRSGNNWVPTALIRGTDGRYFADGTTQAFTPQGACRSSSRSWGYWGGGSSSATSSATSSQSQTASRGGFGSTSSAMSSGSGS